VAGVGFATANYSRLELFNIRQKGNMNAASLYTGEISLYDDPNDGLRVECSERHAESLSHALLAAGFSCDSHRVKIAGTKTISNWVEFKVSNGTFAVMKQIVSQSLTDAGVRFVETAFPVAGDSHVRFDLLNVSAYDR